ncbi:hypothetical protein AAG570_008443 [Ranatra chinensis]|uniref:Uncharacterized protein n=1 Tax=Ranatra chinensis TaxID=642074 RepID=A0ABD0YT32_9HEMI
MLGAIVGWSSLHSSRLAASLCPQLYVHPVVIITLSSIMLLKLGKSFGSTFDSLSATKSKVTTNKHFCSLSLQQDYYALAIFPTHPYTPGTIERSSSSPQGCTFGPWKRSNTSGQARIPV